MITPSSLLILYNKYLELEITYFFPLKYLILPMYSIIIFKDSRNGPVAKWLRQWTATP